MRERGAPRRLEKWGQSLSFHEVPAEFPLASGARRLPELGDFTAVRAAERLSWGTVATIAIASRLAPLPGLLSLQRV